MQRGVGRTGAVQALGEFMEGGEVGDPARQPVLEHRTRGGWGRSGRKGRGIVGGGGNRWIDSSHFRYVRGAHDRRLSCWCVLLNSIANPHVILRRYQYTHMYTHK
ncbi:hypothetical protein GCM10010446_34750 [Streptomyces enissocaesilis]|uniref:Uncharacterized protein n=1 Tax=Streptomyces enissocaesilis TaxID=332589 RepID=A0ABN3XDB7_9ACTN